MTTRLTKCGDYNQRKETLSISATIRVSAVSGPGVRLFDQAMAFVVVRCASTRDAPAPARAPVGSPTPVRRRPYIVAGIAGRALGLKAK